jgi:hypothetical protein
METYKNLEVNLHKMLELASICINALLYMFNDIQSDQT